VTSAEKPSPTPARGCDGCTLCCKVLRVSALQKPHGVWCEHCAIGAGCRIYDRRPGECRSFNCGFLQLDYLTEEWRPANSKIVIVAELDGSRIAAHVDPDRPGSWRREPYYSQLKEWSRLGARNRRQVVVYVRNRVFVILPDKEVDLGTLANDELIVTQEFTNQRGEKTLHAVKMKKDDPRAAKLNIKDLES
jgi:hypothetical protein